MKSPRHQTWIGFTEDEHCLQVDTSRRATLETFKSDVPPTQQPKIKVILMGPHVNMTQCSIVGSFCLRNENKDGVSGSVILSAFSNHIKWLKSTCLINVLLQAWSRIRNIAKINRHFSINWAWLFLVDYFVSVFSKLPQTGFFACLYGNFCLLIILLQ